MNIAASRLDALLNEARHLALDAGAEIMTIYETGFDIEHKADRTPLTTADMASHNLICEGLARLAPDLPILSEESSHTPFSERAKWDCYWLIDPLDGTREFIKRNGEFTVNIALIENHEPVLGVVYAPVLRQNYFACRGSGAFKQCGSSAPQPVYTRTTPSMPTIAGSRSHGSEAMQAFLARLGEHELINMGSALKSCLVAEGSADIYPRFGLTSEWDTAAAQCVVEEAGGQITDMSFNPMRYNTKDSLLNPHFLVIGDGAYDWAQYLR